MNAKLQQVLAYAALGIKTIPLRGKVPFLTDWPNRASVDPDTLKQWHASGRYNIGVPTGSANNMLVVDFDDRAIASAFYRRHRGKLKTCVVTRRGLHVAFRPPADTWPSSTFPGGDLKSDGGQVCWPVSEVQGHVYRFLDGHGLVPPSELPLFDPDYLPKSGKRPITRKPVGNVAAYVMKVQSIQGQNGSHGLVRACAICRDAGLTESDAMLVLLKWNDQTDRVSPPWPPEDIARACHRMYAGAVPL